MKNTGVTGHFKPPQNDFEHARGPLHSAYAFWLMTDIPTDRPTDRPTYISPEISIEHPSVELTSLAQLTRKMVPITGRVSSLLEIILYV